MLYATVGQILDVKLFKKVEKRMQEVGVLPVQVRCFHKKLSPESRLNRS